MFALVHTFAAWVQALVCGGARVASVASVGTLPIGILQQQARFLSGHGCFSRRAFLFPFFFHFDSDRSVATHAQHVLPFLTTLRCRKTRSAGADYCRLNLQEWSTGTFGVLLPPGNNFKPLWLQRRATCWRSEPSGGKRREWATTGAAGWHRRSGCTSCGCCITQRWARVRKTWQWHLLSQLPPPAQLSGHGRQVGCLVCFKSTIEKEDGLWAFPFVQLLFLGGFILFTELRRLGFCAAGLEKRVMTRNSLHWEGEIHHCHK